MFDPCNSTKLNRSARVHKSPSSGARVLGTLNTVSDSDVREEGHYKC